MVFYAIVRTLGRQRIDSHRLKDTKCSFYTIIIDNAPMFFLDQFNSVLIFEKCENVDR